ncbi:hypothetical protein [Streptomyces sp. SID11385]|nr:hypothetical protein [Streptomyces sp. SID11385]
MLASTEPTPRPDRDREDTEGERVPTRYSRLLRDNARKGDSK